MKTKLVAGLFDGDRLFEAFLEDGLGGLVLARGIEGVRLLGGLLGRVPIIDPLSAEPFQAIVIAQVQLVEGLVVADASLMPTITSSNTNLASLMIGERFGAWLR